MQLVKPKTNMMTLVDIISIDGLPLTLTMIEDRVLQLRLISRKMMTALESNYSMNIKIRINDAGVNNLSAAFLQRWHGRIYLECTYPCNSDIRWFREVTYALLSARLRPLSQLGLAVYGGDLRSVVETLVGIRTAIQQLEIVFDGDGKELLAASAPISSLGHALTLKLSILGSDPGGRQTSLWLQHLVSSSIRISSISFWSVYY